MRKTSIMKTTVKLFFLLIVLAFACASPQKLVQKGEYDKAIHKLVHKLIAKPDNLKHIATLQHAMRVVNEQNLDSIRFLRQSGQPDIWYAIYQNYYHLKLREDLIKTLPGRVLEKIDFKYTDYGENIKNAKTKASAYYYAHAEKLLETGNKSNARVAYGELMKITKMFDDYKDTEELIRKALVLGTDYILYTVNNRTSSVIPASLMFQLKNLNLMDLDKKFLNFNTEPVPGRTYDYNIVLTLTNVDVSPERVKENHFTETKKIIEKYIDKKDKEGNIVKDENGDPVKVPVYKEVKCDITEVVKTKSVRLMGFVDFRNNHTQQIVNSTPVSAESVFNNISAYAHGDLRACSKKTLALLDQPKLPFPPTSDMLSDAGEKLKKVIKHVLWHDEDYLEN